MARSVGRVRLGVVKQYISEQAAHHGYEKRVRPPVSRYSAEEAVTLTAAHASFELNHHLVFATRYRRGVFDSALGEELIQYWQPRQRPRAASPLIESLPCPIIRICW